MELTLYLDAVGEGVNKDLILYPVHSRAWSFAIKGGVREGRGGEGLDSDLSRN